MPAVSGRELPRSAKVGQIVAKILQHDNGRRLCRSALCGWAVRMIEPNAALMAKALVGI